MTDKEQLEYVGTKIKLELSTRLSSAEYMLWIHNLKPYRIENGIIFFIAQSENVIETIHRNYMNIFANAAKAAKTDIVDFLFFTADQVKDNPELPGNDKKIINENRINPFISKYTFENFVIADNNRFAATAAKAVAEKTDYTDDLLTLNPLYIYGGVGLGKTHLLHAIGNYTFENNPSLNVIYTTAEKISNDYFASLNQYSSDKDSYRNFRKKYSQCDILMVDDVQFMQKKGGLQEVFFHIFNDLYTSQKQIVLSSDRPPKEINDIEDRLRSRFEGGIMTDISAPSLDTRMNIILKKLASSNQTLDEETIFYLAETVNTNIRELEGALQKVIMFANLTHRKATVEVAKEALKEKDKDKEEIIDSDKIIQAVSEYFCIGVSEILGKKKTKDITEARMVAIYLVCDILNLPLVSIGQIFGGRDHTTIIYSRDKITSLITTKPSIEKAVRQIKTNLKC